MGEWRSFFVILAGLAAFYRKTSKSAPGLNKDVNQSVLVQWVTWRGNRASLKFAAPNAPKRDLSGIRPKPSVNKSRRTTVKLTPGKLAGMKAVSDKRGVIAAAAMDQRGSLQKALAKEKGADVSTSMLEEFKSIVTEVLTPHASAILLDPEFGLPASKRRSKNTGLLL